jgi:transposase
MARYKHYSYAQGKMIPVNFKEQILPGSFEYALNHIIDNELDLSIFDERYKNDETGAPAIDPAIMLKIVLYAYSRGIISSRKIERCCRENVVFMALSADTRPHFTTVADFISTMDKEVGSLFSNVLLICDDMGLIGKEMFAIDGCKISSNASKEWSGTREDFVRKQEKIEKAMDYILKKHRGEDKKEGSNLSLDEEEKRHIENLTKKSQKIKKWLSENKDRKGKSDKPIKSNMTDNESAKMPSSHGVIQGYNGIAAADSKHQIVVHAEAIGSGSEQDSLKPMIEGIRENFRNTGKDEDVLKDAKLLADSGFHSSDNMKMLDSEEIDGYVVDNRFRKRDPRFESADRHKKPIKKEKAKRKYFAPADFIHDEERRKAICPAGKEMYLENSSFQVKGAKGIVYKGKIIDCRECAIREKCLRNPNTKSRQVTFFYSKAKTPHEAHTQNMINKIDSDEGRKIYSKRMGLIEPVFGNIRGTIGLDRFTLRGIKKVTTQWKLFCMVHNLGKIYRYGMAAG